jgi:prepilin signal peptidase PulO-like enzyme (type II secretory pathway)
MRHELKRVDPLRAANVGALVYGLLMTAFALLLFPFFLLVALFAPQEEGFPGGALFSVLILFVYPILGLVMGWISGALTSVIYNLVIRWTGGLIIDFESGPVETAVS